jgi:hypothetical protein
VLFNDIAPKAKVVQHQIDMRTMVRKEAVVACFQGIVWNSPEETA